MASSKCALVQLLLALTCVSLSISPSSGAIMQVLKFMAEKQPPKDKCSPFVLDRCLKRLTNITMDPELSYPTTAAKLENTCSVLSQVENCTVQYMNGCAAAEVKQMFRQMIDGTRLTIKNICQKGPTQKEYLTYSKCYNKVVTTHCPAAHKLFSTLVVEMIEQAMQSRKDNKAGNQQQTAANDNDDQDKLKRFCCAYKWNSECQVKNIGQHCPEGSSTFFNYHNGKMTQTMMDEHCNAYTKDSDCRKKPDWLSSDSFVESSSRKPRLLSVQNFFSKYKPNRFVPTNASGHPWMMMYKFRLMIALLLSSVGYIGMPTLIRM